MGRKTFESLPNGALPNRTNIVITRDSSYEATGVVVVTSLEAALEEAKKVEQEEIFVIGGAQIFALTLPLADRIYMTVVETAPEADIFFPELDEQWIETESEDHSSDGKNPYNYRYITYDRRKIV
jgi:dihydrofolate reductase